jgi:hypothetical protein
MDWEIIQENIALWISVLFIVLAVIFYKVSDISPLKEILLLLAVIMLIIVFILKYLPICGDKCQ